MEISNFKIIDLRLREKVRALSIPAILVLAIVFNIQTIWIFIYFLCIDPFLSTYMISCPYCQNNFFKIKYFAYPLYEEKERISCQHCNQNPIIISDRLPSDNLQAVINEPICDFRIIERKNAFQVFVSIIFTQIFLLIIYIVLKDGLKIQDLTPLYGVSAVLFFVTLYWNVLKTYQKTNCVKCNSTYLNSTSNLIAAFKQIKNCECNSCHEKIFTRSYFVSTDFYSFINRKEKEN